MCTCNGFVSVRRRTITWSETMSFPKCSPLPQNLNRNKITENKMPSAKCRVHMFIGLLVIAHWFQLMPPSWKYFVILISNKDILTLASAAARFKITVSHYRYNNSQHKDQNPFQCKEFLCMNISIKKMLSAVLRLSYLYYRNLFTGKTASLYWDHPKWLHSGLAFVMLISLL